MRFPTIEEMAKDVAEKVMNEYEYEGKTIRQWIEVLKDYDDKQATLQRILERLEECKETHDRRLLSKKETASFKIKELQFSGCYQNAIEIVKEEGGIE